MMKDEATSSIWDSPEVQRQRERRFSMTLLKVMVTNLEFVNDAQIAIDEPNQIRGPGRSFFPATASITVSTLNGPLSAGQARTIRNLVASGVSGMEVSNVTVSDQAGTLFAGDDRGAGAAAQLDGVSRGVETHYEQQIREVLAIDGLRVAVSALAEPRSSFESGREHGDPVTASKRGASELMKQRGASGGGRPGFGSNVATRANQPLGVSSAQNFAELEAEDFDNDVIVDAVDIAIENPGGYVYKLSAVLNVPYLYLRERYVAESASDTEPTPQQLDELKRVVDIEFANAISMMLQTPPPASNLKGDVVPGDVTVLFGHGAFAVSDSSSGFRSDGRHRWSGTRGGQSTARYPNLVAGRACRAWYRSHVHDGPTCFQDRPSTDRRGIAGAGAHPRRRRRCGARGGVRNRCPPRGT